MAVQQNLGTLATMHPLEPLFFGAADAERSRIGSLGLGVTCFTLSICWVVRSLLVPCFARQLGLRGPSTLRTAPLMASPHGPGACLAAPTLGRGW